MADAICMGELLIRFVPVATGTNLLNACTFHKAYVSLGGWTQ
jgi:hypothetical protein